MSERTIANIRLEEALPHHTQDIWEMIKGSFIGKSHAPYIATGQPGYQTYLRDRLTQGRLESKHLFLARVDGHIAAFADVTLNDDTANFLTRVAVSPAFRGRNIARAMMQGIQETYLVENRWELDVLSSNPGARNLYRSLGFKTTSRRKWVGRMLPRDHIRCEMGDTAYDTYDSNYLRYGFTTTEVQGRTFAIAGSSIRCYDTSSFLSNSLLRNVQEKFPQTDRAFIILDAAENRVEALSNVFEIVRSERMSGFF